MLDDALGSYAGGALRAVAAVRADFDRRRSALHEAEDDAKSELSRLREAYDDASDDDDCESYRQAMEDAADQVAEIRRWIGDVEAQHALLTRRASACDDVLTRSVPRARAFLREKIEQLKQYHAVQLDAATPAKSVADPPTVPVRRESTTGSTGHDAAGARRLQDHRLPQGFRWVSLSEIDLAKQLDGISGPKDFRKVSYEDMRQGLAHLRDHILPALEVDGERRSDYFRDVDQQSGREYSEGLQRVYEAFFGQHDFVYFVRRPDGTLDLINGRHRVKVADDLGWDAVPAQVKD